LLKHAQKIPMIQWGLEPISGYASNQYKFVPQL